MLTIVVFSALRDLEAEPMEDALVVVSPRAAAVLAAQMAQMQPPPSLVYVDTGTAYSVRAPTPVATNVKFIGWQTTAQREEIQNLILKGDAP